MNSQESIVGTAEGCPRPSVLPFTVAESSVMQRVLAHARVVATATTPVLLTGERGAGKHHLARHLHDSSWRANGPFVVVRCAGVPEAELGARIFGGACGGGVPLPGALAEAAGGTLFLDEVADLSEILQERLVRLLRDESRSGVRDVRLVAASTADLERRIADGTFRPDLFYRLSVVRLHVPPLRERPEDIVPLAELFLSAFCVGAGLSEKVIDRDVLDPLTRHAWPANANGLRRAVERAAATSGEAPVVLLEDLPDEIAGARREAPKRPTGAPTQPRMACEPGPTPMCHPVRVPSHESAGPRPMQLWACQYPYPSLRASGPDDSCSDCPIWPEVRRRRVASGE